MHDLPTDEDDKLLNKLNYSWSHLFLWDSRTPEERAEAEAEELKRRRGGNRNWMLKRGEGEQLGM